MKNVSRMVKRSLMIAGLLLVTMNNSGCTLIDGFIGVQYAYGLFWEVTPMIPVSAYWSQKVEDRYWEEERYGKVPILDPIEGEHAPLFCIDPPSDDEVMRALPEEAAGGFAFLAEVTRNNVRITTELIVDKLDDECRFFPLAGPARMHKCHYKCTVYYKKIKRSAWPIPFTHKDETVEVVYIDHDHLIRCAGPDTK